MLQDFNDSKYKDKVLGELDAKGYDTSEKSNIAEIITELSKVDSTNISERNKILSNLSFETRTGESLDEFLEFFGVKRRKEFNTSTHTLKFYNAGDKDITISEGTIFEIDDKHYKSITKQYIYSGKINNLYIVETAVMFYTDIYCEVSGIKIPLDSVIVQDVAEISDKHRYITNVLYLEEHIDFSDGEPDAEYFNRGKSLIQSYGDGNLKKIKDYIVGIPDVANVITKEGIDILEVCVIPQDINKLDSILEQAKEAVDYFKTSNIEVTKPSMTEIKVIGLHSQLSEWFNEGTKEYGDIPEYLIGVKASINNYFKDLYFNDKKEIKRDDIEFNINKYFTDRNIVFVVDEKKLEMNYSVFTPEDYTTPIIISELERRVNKELMTDVVVAKEVA